MYKNVKCLIKVKEIKKNSKTNRNTEVHIIVKTIKKSIEMKKIVISKNLLNKIYRTTQVR